jgi:hypothetical protein
LLNPWYSNIDLRVMQDFAIGSGARKHGFQVSVDILNFANLLNSDWGVRKVATASATSPLSLVRFEASGAPVFNFTGPTETFVDEPGPVLPVAGAARDPVLVQLLRTEDSVLSPQSSVLRLLRSNAPPSP